MCRQYDILDTAAYRIDGLSVVCEFRHSLLGSLNYICYLFLIISKLSRRILSMQIHFPDRRGNNGMPNKFF